MKKMQPSELALILAKETADMIKYIGLDDPSNAPYTRIDEMISNFDSDKKQEELEKLIGGMKYKDVMELEREVNSLIESGKYD